MSVSFSFFVSAIETPFTLLHPQRFQSVSQTLISQSKCHFRSVVGDLNMLILQSGFARALITLEQI